jgi:hypothetical protein
MLKQDLKINGQTKEDVNKIIEEIKSEHLEFDRSFIRVPYQY